MSCVLTALQHIRIPKEYAYLQQKICDIIIPLLSNLSLQVHFRLFPAGGAANLSIMDNSCFHDFKQDFSLVYNAQLDVARKEELIKATWANYPAVRFKGYWRKCGYDATLESFYKAHGQDPTNPPIVVQTTMLAFYSHTQ